MSTEMIWETLSTGSAETELLGEFLGNLLSGGETLELVSDLGGGKTTFARGLVAGAGGKDIISSPTFTLTNVYNIRIGKIHHYDLYRLDDPGILVNQLNESLDNPDVITVLEWSGIVKTILPADTISISFKPVASNKRMRNININYPDSKSEIIKELKRSWAGAKR